jgi:hypothetical protein
MEPQKVYVNPDDGRAVLKCPHCGAAKTRYVGKFKGGKRNVKVKCKCQEVYRVSFEFRKAYRKDARLQGFYAKLPQGRDWGKMIVTDISLTGMGFSSMMKHGLKKGDEVKLRFNLDDARGSKIEKKAVVKWVTDTRVGCEFKTSGAEDETSDQALSFYFMR